MNEVTLLAVLTTPAKIFGALKFEMVTMNKEADWAIINQQELESFRQGKTYRHPKN